MYDKCSDCEYGDVENLRLENQEIKKQLEVGKEQYKDLVEEKEKLQQENQELKELNIAISKGLKKVTAKRNKWQNRYYKVRRENGDQQKEFMEWLEKEIQGQEDYAVSLGLTIDYDIAEYTSGKIDALKESLSKYKEIIGVKNE